MSRIHPACNQIKWVKRKTKSDDNPTMLTVWKRSSMSFQGTDGFTVIDEKGRLVFRVDNYSRNTLSASTGGLLLMDGPGNPLLTLKPQSHLQILNMQYQWNAYKGEDEEKKFKVFSMKKGSSSSSSLQLFHKKKNRKKGYYEAEVYMGIESTTTTNPDFRVEGSFKTRNCNIITPTGKLVAKINRKRINSTVLLGEDVFTLLVQPGFDTQLIMAFVVVLDRISTKPFTPFLCS